MNVQGDVTLDSSSTFAVALDGPTPGNGYDQLNTSGTVNLNGSTLDPSLGFSPSTQSFAIIRSTAPIVGTFHGLSQGSTLLIDGSLFTISYDAGDGDEVALTLVGPVQPPQILSAASTTFTAGTAGTFTAAAIGAPVPSWSESGSLPSGVTFVDNHDGSATLAGTPAAGTAGAYHLILTAANGQAPDATEDFTLTVNPSVTPVQPPQILSAASTTFTAGTAGTFTAEAIGGPVPSLSESGALPSGVTFVDNHDGSATLAGMPAPGTGGAYHLVLTAANGQPPDATEDFTLTVDQAPSITSAATSTFVVGAAGSFAMTTSGFPTATLSESGALPSGVTFVDNHDGSATLAGMPAPGTGGAYHLVLTAANGQPPDATEDFTLTVDQAPSITSAATSTFVVGAAGSFAMTTSGFPTATLSESGALPPGVALVDNGNGTATLAGTPAAGTAGTYHLVVTAANGVGQGASQAFTLTVNPATSSTSPPTITSSGGTNFPAGTSGSFLVVATGSPTPTIGESGALPPGVTFVDNGNGTATLAGTPAASAAGAYHLTITADNGIGPAVTESFTLDVVIATPPEVVRLQQLGLHGRPLQIVLSFDEPMGPSSAEMTSNYVLRPVVRGRPVNRTRREIRVTSAVYDPADQTVTLRTAKRLVRHRVYQITVDGTAPTGLTNVSGVLLDGQGNGQPGSDFVSTFSARASK